MEAQRKGQLERYLRGEIIFPRQRYETRNAMEKSLANLRESLGLPPERPAYEDPEVLRQARIELGLESSLVEEMSDGI
jgi:hypothetical protein